MQAGDVPQTWADITEIEKLGCQPTTNIQVGVHKFVDWFEKYHGK